MQKQTKTEPKTVRALTRGLNVMQILQQEGSATLHDIHKASGMPKPTILRLLRTLEKAGWIRRGLDDGLYRNSFNIKGMVDRLDHTDRLAEIAAPYLDWLCQKASWPSDLAVLNSSGSHMELKETSRSLTPFFLNRDSIGHMINLPLSAVGRAYLAFCNVDERKVILDRLKKLRRIENRLINNDDKFSKELAEIRRAGYATREPTFGGGQNPLKSDFDDGLNAVAVPIHSKDKVLGCITVVWVRNAVSIQTIITKHLTELQSAASEIAVKFEQNLTVSG